MDLILATPAVARKTERQPGGAAIGYGGTRATG
jgi:hypothetical protein